jgi:uncharacterized repeat protein (TIGR02543 family)
MRKTKCFDIVLFSLAFLTLFGCEGMATLFHGSKPEEKIPPLQSYTITFDSNGATGAAPASQTVNGGTTIILPNDGGLIFSGKVFTGWCVSQGGTGTTYTVGYSFSVTGNQTLYARWVNAGDIQQYTVTFNANGATGGTPSLSQTVYDGISITIPTQGTLVNTGKNFAGWNTTADGTGISYVAGSSLVVLANIMLYAKWIIDPNADTPLPEGTITVPSGTLSAALLWISMNAASNSSYLVLLTANESIGAHTLSYSGKTNITIILKGSVSNRVISLNANGTLFSISSGITLRLDNRVTLNGRSDNTSSLISISSGGNLVMNNGAKIIGNGNRDSGVIVQ